MADNNITLASNNLSEEAPGDSGEVDTIQFGIPTNSGEEQNFSGFNLPSFSGQSESSNPFGL